jgi:hypothetical protein
VLSALKDRLPLRHRQWLRALADGNPFRIERPTEPVRIGELVSPFRYDVLVRARHFSFHADHRELFATDFDAYARRAAEEPYYVWFTQASWFADRLQGPDQTEAAWRERLRASAALYDSFAERGFDEGYPIEVWAGRDVAPAPSGKRSSRRLFAGDGNHRMALLLASGQTELAPSQYRVRRYRALVPADTTGFLLGATGAGWPEYRSFIELGYPTARVTPDGVACPDARVRAEVEAVVAIDRPRLT